MSPPATSPAPWVFWWASQMVHDLPPPLHMKITEGDLRSVQTQPCSCIWEYPVRSMDCNLTFGVFLGVRPSGTQEGAPAWVREAMLLVPALPLLRFGTGDSSLGLSLSSFDICRARVWTMIYKVPVSANWCFSLPCVSNFSPLLSNVKLISTLLPLLGEGHTFSLSVP